DAGAADQLDHDVDVAVGHHLVGVRGDDRSLADQLAGSVQLLVGHHFHGDGTAGAPRDLLLVAGKHAKGAAAHGADAEEADVDGLHSSPSLRNMSRMPRTACRVRASFSIIAKRTWPSP